MLTSTLPLRITLLVFQQYHSVLYLNKLEGRTKHNIANSNLYLFVNGKGRFENKLFIYASSMGIAKRNNRQVTFGENMLMLKEIFPKLEINLPIEGNIHKPILMQEFHALYVNERLFELPSKNVTKDNYLQSFRYLEDISSDLFRNLSYISSFIEYKVHGFLNQVKKEASVKLSTKHNMLTTVCVHVRRGDYLTGWLRKPGRKTTSAEDVKFAIKFMEEKYKHVIFIVASEDKNRCAKHLGKANVFMSNFNSNVDDFVLLQSCDHMIMTAGTFRWWAGWMTSQRGGTVMYYRDPFTIGSEMYKMYKRHNHYPGHWLAYNNSVVESRLL